MTRWNLRPSQNGNLYGGIFSLSKIPEHIVEGRYAMKLFLDSPFFPPKYFNYYVALDTCCPCFPRIPVKVLVTNCIAFPCTFSPLYALYSTQSVTLVARLLPNTSPFFKFQPNLKSTPINITHSLSSSPSLHTFSLP